MQAPLTLVGEVVVDVMPPVARGGSRRVRLGGVIHAARTAWALGEPYDLLFISPEYLKRAIVEYATRHGAASIECVGTVDGAPNVMLVGEATEAGAQGYEFLLRDEHSVQLAPRIPASVSPESEVLFILSEYPARSLIEVAGVKPTHLHVDVGNFAGDLTAVAPSGCATVFVSTSSPLFLDTCGGDIDLLRRRLDESAASTILKENRGGARYFARNVVKVAGAHVRSVAHSVGVGDCFDVVFLTMRGRVGEGAALAYASLVAAEYASTTFVDDFRAGVGRSLLLAPEEVSELPAVRVQWERRSAINVYVAGPDFDYVDRSAIDATVAALTYHNFKPRRPILENGQIARQSTKSQRRAAFLADTALIAECQIMVAVLPFADPGTLIEIGMAAAKNMPVIVYDPLRLADNVMLTEAPQAVSARLDDVIAAVFREASRLAPNV